VTLTVTPKVITADGKPTTIAVKVTAGKKAVKGVRVLVKGKTVRATAVTNGRGIAVVKVSVQNPGLLRITTISRESCASKQIGVVGVFTPPLTG
jgi:hypothetical protein